MAYQGQVNARRLAHIIDDAELGLRTFTRGTRQLGDPCRLILAMNGEEHLCLPEEEVGDRAPRELVIDIRTRSANAALLLRALETRPWLTPENPVIICPDAQAAQGVCYLIRSTEIAEILQAVRQGLDLDPIPEDARIQVQTDTAIA